MGTSFTTYSGKAVTLTCEYDASKYRLDHWESSLDKHYLGSRPGDTIEYEAVAGETPIAVLVEYGQVNVSAARADDPEKKYKLVEWPKATIRDAPSSTAAMCASTAWTATGASRP